MTKQSHLFIISFFLIFLFDYVLAKEEKVVQIVANHIKTKSNIVTAKEDVLVFTPNYYITANKVIYDKNSSTMELFDNVNIVQNNQKKIVVTKYAFLDLKNEIDSATPILLIDKTTNVWIDAKKLNKKSDLNMIDDATISSCEFSDPAWSIGFSYGDYNESKKWINTYNNTLYIKNIPAWYLIPAYYIFYGPIALEHLIASFIVVKSPYFGFSTDNRRRSGLLVPEITYSQRAGYGYAQPIYFAPADNYDFEYIPQISAKRGRGHELRFRYADSPYSMLEASSGVFEEYNSYKEKYNILNKKHHGYDIKYNRKKLYSSDKDSDGLYLYIQDMNDIEYINTKYGQQNTTKDRLLKSELKYFYNTQSFNGNIEFNRFDDISKENNDDVMQITPKIQLHKYSISLFDMVENSYDLKYTKKHRKVGLGANTTDITIPFNFSYYFFNNYLLFTYQKHFFISKIEYTNNTNTYGDATLIKMNDTFSLDTDLIKQYESILHTINFNISYQIPDILKEKGDLYGINSNDSSLSIFPYTKDLKNMKLSLNQSIYGSKSLKKWFNHKIEQKIIHDKNGSAKLDNLENELTFYFPYTTLTNKLKYNHSDDLIINSSYALKIKKNSFFTNIDYSYSIDKNNTTNSYKDSPKTESITAHIGNKVLKYYTISYKEQYNITDKISNLKEYSLSINKRCWRLDLKLADNLVASATTTNKAIRQNILYATITLKPLVSFKREHTFNEREE